MIFPEGSEVRMLIMCDSNYLDSTTEEEETPSTAASAVAFLIPACKSWLFLICLLCRC